MPKTKLFKCDRCKENTSAIWRISVLELQPFDLCDKCKNKLGDKIVEFVG